jgi:DNA-binding transcriptional LysR family regulator
MYKMDTNLLRIFLTYSKTQNLRMTAEFHHTSHVAVIRALKNLEDLTGLKLTMRVGRGSVLSPAGKNLIGAAERILAEERNLLSYAKNEVDLHSEFRVATFEVFSTHLAPKLNAAVGLETRTVWIEKVPGEIEQAVRMGTAEVGITYTPIPTPDVEHLKICSIKMGLYQGQKLLYKETKLEKIPFVIPAQPEHAPPTKAKGLDGWPDYRIPRRIHYKVTLLETALSMVAAGQCIGYFPAFVVELYNSMRTKPLLLELDSFKIKEPNQDVFLVKRISEEETLSMKRVAKLLRTLR